METTGPKIGGITALQVSVPPAAHTIRALCHPSDQHPGGTTSRTDRTAPCPTCRRPGIISHHIGTPIWPVTEVNRTLLSATPQMLRISRHVCTSIRTLLPIMSLNVPHVDVERATATFLSLKSPSQHHLHNLFRLSCSVPTVKIFFRVAFALIVHLIPPCVTPCSTHHVIFLALLFSPHTLSVIPDFSNLFQNS